MPMNSQNCLVHSSNTSKGQGITLNQTIYQESLIKLPGTYPQSSISSFVGIIRTNWRSKDGKITSISYGSAVYISKNIILTCIHNVYSERNHLFCTEIFFIPGVKEGRIDYKNKVYKSEYQDFYRCQVPNRPLGIQPLAEELCLILLQKEIPFEGEINFPKVSSLEESQFNCDLKLKIIGYPSANYYSHTDLKYIEVKREDLCGNFTSRKNFVINYDIKTKLGQSGSPIIATNQHGQQIIIGIHTHKGLHQDYNSGILFTPQIMQKFNKYLYDFRKKVGDQEPTIIKPMIYDDEQDQKLAFVKVKQQSDDESSQTSEQSDIQMFFLDNFLLQISTENHSSTNQKSLSTEITCCY